MLFRRSRLRHQGQTMKTTRVLLICFAFTYIFVTIGAFEGSCESGCEDRYNSPSLPDDMQIQAGNCDDCDDGTVCNDLGFYGSVGLSDASDSYLADYFAFIKHMMQSKIGKSMFVNFEHTLHSPDSGNKGNAPIGNIPLIDGTSRTYHVYIPNWSSGWEYYIDYSMANVENIRRSNTHPDITPKIIYTPALMYPCKWHEVERSIDVLTTWIWANTPRRLSFTKMLSEYNVNAINVNNVFGWEETKNLYQKSKILINIRQYDDRHTLEELRILPALLNGVIVVCEEAPLQEVVPYHEYILFGKWSELPGIIRDTMANYDEVHARIFGTASKLPSVIREMKRKLQADIEYFASKRKAE